MATRTNFYKNSSSAYNKQLNLNSVLQNLNSYNIATGNAPPEEPVTTVKRKRRRESRPPLDQRNGVKKNDGPMSHEEYIEKRRKEADASQPYQKLAADVLERSSSTLNLVGYESDECSSTDSEEGCGPSRNSEELLNPSNDMQYFPVSAITEDADHIKTRCEQRYPAPGEPVCIICGNYGEYISEETNDDICSMECKVELLRIKFQKESQGEELPVALLSARRCTLEVPESGGDTWDYDRHCWSKKISGLCTYECWKCRKPGHLPEDWLALASSESSPAGEVSTAHNRSSTISRDLLDLYKRFLMPGLLKFSLLGTVSRISSVVDTLYMDDKLNLLQQNFLLSMSLAAADVCHFIMMPNVSFWLG